MLHSDWSEDVTYQLNGSTVRLVIRTETNSGVKGSKQFSTRFLQRPVTLLEDLHARCFIPYIIHFFKNQPSSHPTLRKRSLTAEYTDLLTCL